MAAVALALTAWRSHSAPRRLWLAAAAGVFAGAAPLVKQNFLEGLLFVAVLLASSSLSHRRIDRREAAVALGAGAGALLPHLVVGLWAVATGIELVTIWHDLVTFRGQAFEVIWSNNPQASIERGVQLCLLGLVSGVLVAVVTWLSSTRPWRGRASPEQWAVTGCVAFGLASIIGGGSYWPHYLIELAPGVALAVGAVASQMSRAGRWMRGAGRTVVVTAVLGTLLVQVVYLSVPWVWFQQRTGEWLAASSAPGDTAFIAYGNPSMLEAADMESPYPYLWSLPMRTLDPELSRLRATLAGPDAPTWIVQVNGFDSWGIDTGSRLENLVEERYRLVGEVCGNPVWLREGLTRRPAPWPDC
jgi:hypothetical protein